MLFAERARKEGENLSHAYSYECEDVFGTIAYHTDFRMTKELLDTATVALLRVKGGGAILSGELASEKGSIHYVFTRRPEWEPADLDEEGKPLEEESDTKPNEEEPWTDTPTSTNETDDAS